MNKHNIIFSLGLLSATYLSSCKEEVFNELENNNNLEYKHYTAEMGIEIFTADDKNGSRANVQDDGKSFMWNTNDAVSIWDGTATGNFKFSVPADYDDSTPKNKLVFRGDASLANDAIVWGVYPYTDAANVFGDKNVKFTLPENATQNATGKPGLQKTMFMIAEGTVSGSNIEKLNFHHLTGIFQFNITNNGEEAVTISSVKVSANSALFPTVVTATVGGEGISYAYSEEKNALTLTFAETQSIEPERSLSGYMSLLPSKVTADTELTIYVNNKEIKKGTVKDLYGSSSSVAANGYEAGKRYVINLTTEKVKPDTGYEDLGDGKYSVTAAKGLVALAEKFGESNTSITLADNIDMSELAETRSAYIWESKDFAGTFDGNGKTISNVFISGNNVGFFKTNTGSIKNLKISNVTVEGEHKDTDHFTGILTGSNIGVIEGCEILLSKATSKGTVDGNIGGFAGLNNGKIIDCVITSGTITATVGSRTGGVAGKNAGTIQGSSSQKDVTVKMEGDFVNANAGGLIGWNSVDGKVYACYSLANIVINTKGAQSVGGLIGAIAPNNEISLCFSSGTITDDQSRACTIGGLIGNCWIGQNATGTGVKGCYTTTVLPKTNFSKRYSFLGNYNLKDKLTFQSCYYTQQYQSTIDAEISGIEKAETIGTTEAEAMNSASGVTGYRFIVGTGDIPLTIEKVTE